MYLPKGIIPALATPFNKDGSIDYESNKVYLNHLIEEGVDGLLVGGSTGEYTLLSPEERRELIQTAIKDVNGRVPVIVGTSCHRPEDTIELTRFAEDAGADAVLVLAPHYLKTSDEGIVNYFKKIAASTNIGVVIYHYPEGTGVTMNGALLKELSEVDGIVGVKSTTDFTLLSQTMEATKDSEKFTVLTGYQHTLLPALAAGGDGVICVIPGLVPKEIIRIYNLIVKENDIKSAANLNKKLIELYNYVDAAPFPGNLKAGLAALGFMSDVVRDPLAQAAPEMSKVIKSKLRELGHNIEVNV